MTSKILFRTLIGPGCQSRILVSISRVALHNLIWRIARAWRKKSSAERFSSSCFMDVLEIYVSSFFLDLQNGMHSRPWQLPIWNLKAQPSHWGGNSPATSRSTLACPSSHRPASCRCMCLSHLFTEYWFLLRFCILLIDVRTPVSGNSLGTYQGRCRPPLYMEPEFRHSWSRPIAHKRTSKQAWLHYTGVHNCG